MPLTHPELEPLLRLGLVKGVGPHRLAGLIARFGSADGVFAAGEPELCAIPGIGPELARRIRGASSGASLRRTEDAMRLLDRLDASVLSPDDPLYPPGFHHLADPPYLLFLIGDPAAMLSPSIAIVGTRSPSAYGRRAARELSGEIAVSGYGIVSGMARGVDTAAHLGALDVGGMTVGILGHGIDQIYPPENRSLFEAVRDRGLLITEYVPGETPKAGNFPRRNRLITALAQAVLVVEMGHASGAQHTVSYALEQGKEVMAVPGPIGVPSSAGTNQLIRDGALLVTSATDVLELLRGVGARFVTPPGPRSATATGSGPRHAAPRSLPLLTDPESRLLNALSTHPAHIDVVARDAGLDAREALVALLELEIRGLVEPYPGKRFSRA